MYRSVNTYKSNQNNEEEAKKAVIAVLQCMIYRMKKVGMNERDRRKRNAMVTFRMDNGQNRDVVAVHFLHSKFNRRLGSVHSLPRKATGKYNVFIRPM